MTFEACVRLGRQIDLIIFDLDGVVTQTARIHAAAWKHVVDVFLTEHYPAQPPFDPIADYQAYVDGKPRYEGLESFLKARQITLPFGSPEDPPGEATICALGNKKNAAFQELLGEQGVAVYEDAVALMERARRRGIRLAVISSSKNCRKVLAAAHLADNFDVCVDGVEIAKLGLKGKPQPDIFLEAARRLKIAPDRAVIIEDALAGVEAGRAGCFSHVIGVDRKGQTEALKQHGADIVVQSLNEVALCENGAADTVFALDALIEFEHEFDNKRPVLFLDYDGTLTPIVDRPELAVLSADMRRVLEQLSEVALVAIISGRGLEDIRRMVGLENITYAGAHGFDIQGPGGTHIHQPIGEQLILAIDKCERQLGALLKGVPGAIVEGKIYSLAVHYRLVREADLAEVDRAVKTVLSQFPDLKQTEGKKVYEIRSKMDWNKGKALWRIFEALGLSEENSLPIYIGDDITDYDAFDALKNRGIGIIVAQEPPATSAAYYLRTTDDVREFLCAMIGMLRRK